jgi:hypothetical protein
MSTSRELVARTVVDLSEPLAGVHGEPAVGIGWDGTIVAAGRFSAESSVVERTGGTFPKPTLDEPASYVIARWREGELDRWNVGPESIVVSHVQPVDDGVLLVGARSRWRSEGPDRNAVVYGADGRERRRFLLGDGIEDVRSTRRGTLWVSYFDEGVFGNFGWGHPGPEPVGAAGLIEFGAGGERLFSYDPTVAGTDSICDAYALGLDEGGAAWVYFYTEFPIVRVERGRYRLWKTDTEGARALAVRNGYAFLFGDYKRRNLGRIVKLEPNGRARVIEEVGIVDESGSPITGGLAYGVGAALYLVQARRVMVVDVW